MTVTRSVQLEETERTLLRLRQSAGIYQSVVRQKMVSPDNETLLLMGTWVMVLGYTEFYVDGILDLLFLQASSRLPPGAKYVMEREAKKANGSWDARKEALNNVFGVQVGQFRSWQRLDGAIWVRNSIAHGSGALTRMQKRTEVAKAENVGVQVIDGKLYLHGESMDLCVTACCQFVNELDEATRQLV